MIIRTSSNDSTKTYCSVSERRQMQIRRNNHILLKHIHSKVLEHIRMETFLEPHQVHRFLQQIKRLNTDQPDTEEFRKKIRNMLLTINDSLLQFEQAVYSGEVALYPIDISQNCGFTQQSSTTSVGEVPSFSSIELTNTNFMTVPNNSQNCMELDCYESNLNMGKENSINSLICGHVDSKVLNRVNVFGDEKEIAIEGTKMRTLLEDDFKKPIRRKVLKLVNSKMRISPLKKYRELSNKENINYTQLSTQEDYVNSTKTRKRKLNSNNFRSDLYQETFSSELERLHIDPTKIEVICKAEVINDQNAFKNKLYKTLDSNNETNKLTKSNIDGQLDFQDVGAENKPVRKKFCMQYNCGTCDVEISHTAISSNVKGNRALISNATNVVIPATELSLPDTKTENYFNIEAPMTEKRTELLNHCALKIFNPERISSDNESMNEIIIDSNTNSQEFVKEFKPTQNTFVMKHSSENPVNISETFIASQDLFSSYETEVNSSSSAGYKLNSYFNEHIGKQVATSSNLLAINGEIISQPWDIHYYSQESTVNNSDKKNTEFTFESKSGNFQNLREKLSLAKEDCINTWNNFVKALEETKNDVSSLESQREGNQFSKSYEHHYRAVENICKEYKQKFGPEKEISEEDDPYVSIEDTMRRWSEFQDKIKIIKQERKTKRMFHTRRDSTVSINAKQDTFIVEK